MPSWILPVILDEGMCCQKWSELSMVYWLWKQLHADSWSLTGKWVQIEHIVVKSSMLSVTPAGHLALLTHIILPIRSSITPYKCHAGGSHPYPAMASNTHAWCSLSHSPLPIKQHYFSEVLGLAVPTSIVNRVIQQLPYYYFFSRKTLQGKCLKTRKSDFFIRLTVTSLCKDPAFWSCAFSVSQPLSAASGQGLPLPLLREHFGVC